MALAYRDLSRHHVVYKERKDEVEPVSNQLRPRGYWNMPDAQERSEILRLQREFVMAEGELRAAEKVQPNWDGDCAPAPSLVAIESARMLLHRLKEEKFPPTRILPSAEGGTTVCFVDGERYADIEFLNSGEIVAVAYVGKGEPSVWEIDGEDETLTAAIARIRTHISA